MKERIQSNSIDKITKESEDFAKECRSTQYRFGIATLCSVILYSVFSPETFIEYAASIIFVLPFSLWAAKTPLQSKHRWLVYPICYISSLIIYFAYIEVS